MIYANITKLPNGDYVSTEAMNTICSNILFSGAENKRILFTSNAAHDGKSYISMRVLQNLAQRGKKVLLIDADLRKSNLVRDYGIQFGQEVHGLAHFLAGMCSLDDIVCETSIPGAYIIPIGQHVANSIPLISNQRFGALLKAVSKYFDIILIDTPPIGCVVDSAIIAKLCDGAVFVLTYNQTTKRELADIKRQMQLSGCKILGCIINKVSFSTISAKKYYNKSYYNHYNDGYYMPTKRSKGNK